MWSVSIFLCVKVTVSQCHGLDIFTPSKTVRQHNHKASPMSFEAYREEAEIKTIKESGKKT